MRTTSRSATAPNGVFFVPESAFVSVVSPAALPSADGLNHVVVSDRCQIQMEMAEESAERDYWRARWMNQGRRL